MQNNKTMDSIAQKDFEQFCVANDVSPTNMKADFYIAGHIKGQQRMIEKAWLEEFFDTFQKAMEE